MRKWSEIIPYSAVAKSTLTEPLYTVAQDCYLVHAELDFSGSTARLNIRVEETPNYWIELGERGGAESPEITYMGSYPLRAGQRIQAIVRSDEAGSGELKLVFSDVPVGGAHVDRHRLYHEAKSELIALTLVTSTGAGALEISTALDNHQIRYLYGPIQVRQVSGGALETRLYLTDGTSDILIHTEAGVPNNTWTTIDLSTSILKYLGGWPYRLSNGWDLMGAVTAAGAGTTLELRFGGIKYCN